MFVFKRYKFSKQTVIIVTWEKDSLLFNVVKNMSKHVFKLF